MLMSPHMTQLPIYGPITRQDMLITMRVRCPVCRDAFACDDKWIAMPGGPLNEDEAKKAKAGMPYRTLCSAVHYDCVIQRLLRSMNWYQPWGIA